MASSPNLAPTTLERNSLNSNGREPIRIVEAKFAAVSKSGIPVIWQRPSVIADCTVGALIIILS